MKIGTVKAAAWSVLLLFIGAVAPHIVSAFLPKDVDLVADITAVPNLTRNDLAMREWYTAHRDIIEGTSRRLRDTIALDDVSTRKLIEDIETKLRAHTSELKEALAPLTNSRGLLFVTVTNNGERPAEGVFLSIPSALAYANNDQGLSPFIFWLEDDAKLERIPKGGTIKLGTMQQGQTQRLAIWTSNTYTNAFLDDLDGVRIGHQTGVARIVLTRLPTGIALTISRVTSTIWGNAIVVGAMGFFSIALIIWGLPGIYRWIIAPLAVRPTKKSDD